MARVTANSEFLALLNQPGVAKALPVIMAGSKDAAQLAQSISQARNNLNQSSVKIFFVRQTMPITFLVRRFFRSSVVKLTKTLKKSGAARVKTI